jgi:phospholipase A1
VALVGVAVLAVPSLAAPATPGECAREPADSARLACYDRIFRTATPASSSASAAPGAPPARAFSAARDDASPLSTFWELDPEDKRGTFAVRTYLPNYLLPAHLSSRIGTPSSPTHPAEPPTVHYRRIEAKLQVSLRAKVAEDLMQSGADLWFAFTQRALWQVWHPAESSPFRSSDYQPEGILVVPVPRRWRALPDGWRWRLVQLGLAHQSNGQGGSLSRSWNRVWLGAAAERGEFGLQVRAHERVFHPRRIDDNPDIVRSLGRYELQASWLPGRATASVTWRTNLHRLGGRSLQLDWTYPVVHDQPDGLRWYVQLFTGTGETLLDYNHSQTSLGVGVSLFRF